MLPGTSARAARALGDAERAFADCGAEGLSLSHHPEGRLFGGTRALEIATAAPVLPPTRGLTARGRGAVTMRGVRFRARIGDAAGQRLADALNGDAAVQEALRSVHFESVRVEPDGTPVIRHLGGSVVWILIPPLLRSTPLVPEQARATLAAMRALSRHGAAAGDEGDGPGVRQVVGDLRQDV
jgi:hypothetical protein